MGTNNAINNKSTNATETTPSLISPTFSGTWDGWIAANETWTYASATTFIVSGDVTAKYQKGDKIKLTQTSAKYFYVLSATYSDPNTTITVTGGSDYTIANAAIPSPYYSRFVNPFGFPSWFNWSPTLVGFSSNPTNSKYMFRIDGTTCFIVVSQSANGTSNANTFTITIPVTAKTITNMIWSVAMGYAVDNGSATTSALEAAINSGGTTVILSIAGSATGWTTSAGKRAFFQLFYEI